MASALQALERLIDYNIKSKRADVQESLAFMQFGMQKRAAEIKEFGMQMEMLGNANKQFKLNVADNFIRNSGLQSIYNLVPTGIKNFEAAEEELKSIVTQLKSKKVGGVKAKFDDANANDIAAALWEYKNTQDPSSIVNLSNRVESMYQPGYKGNAKDKNLLTAFNKISNLSALRQVGKQAQQTLRDETNILKEQFEFARGDTKIQSGFGMFSDEVAEEFNRQQQQNLPPDIKSIADLVEKETEEPTEEPQSEVRNERIFRQGYEPKLDDEIVEDSKSVLTEDELKGLETNLSSLSKKQVELQNTLDTLVKERDDILDDYQELEESRELALDRLKYFRRIGDSKKINEAAEDFRKIDNLLDKRNSSVDGSVVREKSAYDAISFYGENITRPVSTYSGQVSGTKSEQNVRIKEAIRELESQRNRLSP